MLLVTIPMVHTFQPIDHALAMVLRKASVAVKTSHACQTKSATIAKILFPHPMNTCGVAVPTSHGDHPLVHSSA